MVLRVTNQPPIGGITTTTKEEGTSFLYWDRDNHGAPIGARRTMEITIEMYNDMVRRNAMLEFELKQTRDAQCLTRAECDRLERHDQILLRNNKCLESELQKTNAHLTMTRNDNDSLRKDICELHRQNEVLKGSCAAPSKEQENIISALRKTLEGANKDIKYSEQLRFQCINDLQNVKDRNKNLQARIIHLEEINAKLTKEMDSCKTEEIDNLNNYTSILEATIKRQDKKIQLIREALG